MGKKSKKSVKVEAKVMANKHESRVILLGSLIVVLLLASFSVYANALTNGFVYDDNWQVLKNEWMKEVKFIPEIFSKSVWAFETEHSSSNYYRPFMHLIYMINYHIFGLSPWGFHLVNILFHGGVTALVFLITVDFLHKSSPSVSNASLLPALIAALLFATHPIHTEAVTWVAGIPDLSFTFFSLLSFYFYTRSQTTGNYLSSIMSFSIAVFCKEPALTLPIFLVAYDYLYRKEENRSTVRLSRYIPFISVAIIYLILRAYALGGFAPKQRHAELSNFQYIINVFPLFIQYIKKIFVPLDLNAFYVFHPIASLYEMRGWLSLIITALFVFFSYVAWKKQRAVLFGLIFFAIPLLPVLYIPGLGENTFAERYLYLPSVGLSILVAFFIKWARTEMPKVGYGVALMSFLLIGIYSAGTINRNVVWKDNATLYIDTIKKSPGASIIRNNYGNILERKGRIDEAIEQYQAALTANPNYDVAHSNLGLAFFNKGLIDEAIEQYRIALKLNPAYSNAYNNLGVAYGASGSIDKAIEQLHISIKLNAANADAYSNLGRAYREKGLLDKSIEYFETAVKLDPANSTFRSELDSTYKLMTQGR
jgi:tetratricopeptide (TPR) repeat protein